MNINFMQKIKDGVKKIPFSHWSYDTLFTIFIVLSILGSLYLSEQFRKISNSLDSLSSRVVLLESEFSSTTKKLEENITKTHSDLSAVIDQEKQNVEDKLSDYSDTVNTLEKLSKTDPELLQKYSKVFFLNEYYSPAKLTEIPSEYKYDEKKTLQIDTDVWPYLKRMLDAAKDDDIEIYISSGFRSFNEQSNLKSSYSITYGAGTANQFSADQGYSEHQLGTAVDLITTGTNSALEGFEKTPAYEWLNKNAYKYGFIISYPKNNTFYIFEPWHWRFVGVRLAKYLHNQDKNFYDLDQRKIDEYLVYLFD